MSTKIVLDGLNKLDADELEKALKGQLIEILAPEVPEGTLAEPGTITAIVTLTPIAAVALSAYLAKPRRRKMIRRKARIIHPDGRIEESEWESTESQEDALKPQLLAQLTKWLKR